VQADGTRRLNRPDGTQVFTHTNGITVVVTSDGQKIQTSPDGTRIVTQLDGTRIQTNPEGLQIITHLDGTKTQASRDGATVTTLLDGTQTGIRVDGSHYTRRPNGTVIEHTSNVGPSSHVMQMSNCEASIDALQGSIVTFQDNAVLIELSSDSNFAGSFELKWVQATEGSVKAVSQGVDSCTLRYTPPKGFTGNDEVHYGSLQDGCVDEHTIQIYVSKSFDVNDTSSVYKSDTTHADGKEDSSVSMSVDTDSSRLGLWSVAC